MHISAWRTTQLVDDHRTGLPTYLVAKENKGSDGFANIVLTAELNTILHGSALWTSYYTDGNVAGVFVTSDRMDNMVIYKSPEFANTNRYRNVFQRYRRR